MSDWARAFWRSPVLPPPPPLPTGKWLWSPWPSDCAGAGCDSTALVTVARVWPWSVWPGCACSPPPLPWWCVCCSWPAALPPPPSCSFVAWSCCPLTAPRCTVDPGAPPSPSPQERPAALAGAETAVCRKTTGTRGEATARGATIETRCAWAGGLGFAACGLAACGFGAGGFPPYDFVQLAWDLKWRWPASPSPPAAIALAATAAALTPIAAPPPPKSAEREGGTGRAPSAFHADRCARWRRAAEAHSLHSRR